MLKAYQYALLPTAEQQQQLARFFGCCRFIYNLGWQVKRQAWASLRKQVSWTHLARQVKQLKATEAPWLKQCPSQPLQMVLRNLDQAYANFFKGAAVSPNSNPSTLNSLYNFRKGLQQTFRAVPSLCPS